MPLIGYARVLTEDQNPLPQVQALKAAGCSAVHEEQASGGDRSRPVLARLLRSNGPLPANAAVWGAADPDVILRAICDDLEAICDRISREPTTWQPSSVRTSLDRAEKLGVL